MTTNTNGARFADVTIRRDVSLRSYWPRGGKVADVLNLNHEWVDLLDWFDEGQVRALLEEEALILADWFDGGALPSDFDDVGETPDDFLRAAVAEPGTAGAVAVLNLLGCRTFWSCNGEAHGDKVPNVHFWAKAAIVPSLIAAAESANVGLVENNEGIEVFAGNRKGLHDFAQALLHRVRRSAGSEA